MGSDTRQFRTDFDTSSRIITNKGSLLFRPDALVTDPLVAYALGPVALTDVSEGIEARVWRVRVDNQLGNVLVAVADAGNTDFGGEAILFSFSGVDIDEIDIAFDQSGRANVSAGRASGGAEQQHIWLFFFNTDIPGVDFKDFGEGRNPRVIIDVPEDPLTSDVLLFYIDDGTNELVYRQQRDKFLTPISTGFSTSSNFTLEDLHRSVDNRIQAIVAEHVISTGTYNLTNVESLLLPFSPNPEAMQLGAEFQSGIEIVVLFIVGQAGTPGALAFADEEAIQLGSEFQSGALIEPLIIIDPQNSQGSGVSPEEAMQLGAEFQSGAQVLIVIEGGPAGPDFFADEEAIQLGAEFQSGTQVDIVILPIVDEEAMQLGAEFQSGTLIVP